MNNPLRTKIGIIGGGQLGRMMIEETLRLNNEFNILDTEDCPCASLATNHIVGKLTDGDAIRKLAAISDVITYEIEHIDVDTLLTLEEQGKEIIPSPKVLQIIQDKGTQKQFFTDHHIPTAPFWYINDRNDWVSHLERMKAQGIERFVHKTRKDGYDGKGVSIFNVHALLADPSAIPGTGNSIFEAFIPCEKEISVMVARDRNGEIKTWPVVEMVFDPEANLVTFLDCPASLSEIVAEKARSIAVGVIEKLNGVGVFAVEMFLTSQGDILVNEIAPRPHNSGHHTIEACYTSQFEQLVRILCGLPLGSTGLIQPGVMMNLLGATDFSGSYRLRGLEEVSAIEGVYVHLYGKTESKPVRKMGHITITAPSLHEAKQKAQKVYETVRFVPDKA